jgi:outer membrane protein assembly factor BamD (BamD/ComL family)
MVQQQLEVGRYYLERSREYTSAIFCFEDVVRQKSINPDAAKEAEALLLKAKQAAETAAQKS